MREVLFSLVALAAFSMTGCDGSDKAPDPVVANQVAVNSVAASPKTDGRLLVSIIPDQPTADGCLKALVSESPQVSYQWEINGREVEGQTLNVLCEGLRRDDLVKVTVKAGKLTGSASVTLGNSPPRITEVSINTDALLSHTDLVVKAEVIDVDGDWVNLRFQWYVNELTDPTLSESTLPANRYARGDKIRFTIVATDGRAESKLYESAIATVPNALPVIVSNPPEGITSLDYRYQVEVKDPDDSTFTFRLADAPNGMRIGEKNGLIEWSLVGVAPGDYTITIIAADPMGAEAAQGYRLTLGAP